MKYVRLEKDIVAEIIPEFNPLFPNVPVAERYPAEFVKKLVAVDENVQVGMVKAEDGKFEFKKVIISISDSVQKIREDKIKELSEKCSQKISYGFDLNGEHYSMSIADQLNMEVLYNDISNGAESVVYHSDNEEIKLYSKESFMEIYNAGRRHKLNETVYFNLLKQYVNSLDDAEKIRNVRYGQNLDGTYLENYNKLINAL